MENPFRRIHMPETTALVSAANVATEAEILAKRALVITGRQVVNHLTAIGMVGMVFIAGGLVKRIDTDLNQPYPGQYENLSQKWAIPTAVPDHRLDLAPREKVKPVLTVAEYVRIASLLLTEKGLDMKQNSLTRQMVDNGYQILSQWPFLIPLERSETLTVADKPINMQRIPVAADDGRFGQNIITEELHEGDKFNVYSILAIVDQNGKVRVMALTNRFKATSLGPGEQASDSPNIFNQKRIDPAWAQIGSGDDTDSIIYNLVISDHFREEVDRTIKPLSDNGNDTKSV